MWRTTLFRRGDTYPVDWCFDVINSAHATPTRYQLPWIGASKLVSNCSLTAQQGRWPERAHQGGVGVNQAGIVNFVTRKRVLDRPKTSKFSVWAARYSILSFVVHQNCTCFIGVILWQVLFMMSQWHSQLGCLVDCVNIALLKRSEQNNERISFVM